MTKKEVQKKVSQNGEPLDLSKFEWDEKTNTFSSNEDNLVLDFNYVDDCTFKTGFNCTFDTRDNCVVVRRDVYEIIEVPANRQIKLNGFEVKGFTYLDENKSIELSNGAKVSEKTIREALEFVAKHK